MLCKQNSPNELYSRNFPTHINLFMLVILNYYDAVRLKQRNKFLLSHKETFLRLNDERFFAE